MKSIKICSITTLFFFFSISAIQELKAQSAAKANEVQAFQDTILHLDSLFWEAYNNCDVDKYQNFFSKELEFYHDKGGITKTLDKLIEVSRTNMCGNENWRIRRVLTEGSLRFFPLYDNGNIYGAILSGEHEFFINKKGEEEYADGIAFFTHLWLSEEGKWKMSRILSYDHRPHPSLVQGNRKSLRENE